MHDLVLVGGEGALRTKLGGTRGTTVLWMHGQSASQTGVSRRPIARNDVPLNCNMLSVASEPSILRLPAPERVKDIGAFASVMILSSLIV